MKESDRVRDWVNLYKQSPLNYEMNTLISVYKNDGEAMLRKVLRELGLDHSVDLVKDAAK